MVKRDNIFFILFCCCLCLFIFGAYYQTIVEPRIVITRVDSTYVSGKLEFVEMNSSAPDYSTIQGKFSLSASVIGFLGFFVLAGIHYLTTENSKETLKNK